jgi:alpha-glucuronidase
MSDLEIHPAWLPAEAWQAIGSRRTLIDGAGTLVETALAEIGDACVLYGGEVWRGEAPVPVDLALRLTPPADDDWFALTRVQGTTTVRAGTPAGLLYGMFQVLRLGEAAFGDDFPARIERPAARRRMLDHWDNVDVHPVMGQVERGYAGGSLFWRDGVLNDLDRVRAYGRLLAACGINAITVNNVNVHRGEALLLTDRIADVAAIAGVLRPYGIRVHLSVSFAAPILAGGLPTADPMDSRVRDWWAETTDRVYAAIEDFGGYVVKADSEGQPGPFAYGRSHAEGANLLARALEPHGGVVHWRAFVYNHRQDWLDRSTDRAKAAYDHFTPLDGRFRPNVILQVKHGPMDFQAREPVSPVIAAMPNTGLAVELQITQEYTGQQKHVCWLGPQWSELLRFRFTARTVSDLAVGGLVGVSNAGDDPFWTGHPLAQANLYAFGRLAWDPYLRPAAVLDEWIGLTFGAGDPSLRRTLHLMMDESWRTYERYTAPLGVGFMVRPGHHYGPDVDGYEYSPWGTYHFADRDGVGADRTRASGTGFTGQYPLPWSELYESVRTCPDELLLFFHHVPYGHVLHDGSTVIQHIYDSHFAGAEQAANLVDLWQAVPVKGLLSKAMHVRVAELLAEQARSAREWRDQINAYFWRKSGIPDEHNRPIDGRIQ